jgi:predicted RNase H-like HicB family nuclease
MAGSARRAPDADEITVRKSDGYFVARDEETGVSSQGESKEEALANLAEALTLYNDSSDHVQESDIPVSTAPWLNSN